MLFEGELMLIEDGGETALHAGAIACGLSKRLPATAITWSITGRNVRFILEIGSRQRADLSTTCSDTLTR